MDSAHSEVEGVVVVLEIGIVQASVIAILRRYRVPIGAEAIAPVESL